MYFDLKELWKDSDDGFTVFAYYFGNDPKLKDPHHKFKIRPEKTASAKLSYFKGSWRVTDFGNQGEINGMNAIDFVMYRENLLFADAVKYIWEVILHRSIVAGNFRPAKREAIYASRKFDPEIDRLKEYRFFCKKEPLPEEIKYIGRYVTKELLARFNCKSVEYYEYPDYSEKQNANIVHIFKSHVEYPIFLFDYGEFKKMYRPLDKNKNHRFQYIGKKPENHIFGLKQLLNTTPEFVSDDDEAEAEAQDEHDEHDETDEAEEMEAPKHKRIVKQLFRCSGESDAINLASLGYHVYWLNSESADYSAQQFREIDQYCEKHYQIMDLDKTGQKEARTNALKHIEIYNIILPDWITHHLDWRGNPCKDLKDFINLSGHSKDETERDFAILKSNARRAKFWDKSKKKDKEGKKNILFSMENFYFFLKLNGFYRINKTYVRKYDYMYVKIDDDKVFYLISPAKIQSTVKTFTKNWIENRKMMYAIPLLDKINTSNYITPANLEGLSEIELNFRNCSQNVEYLHFANGLSIKITPDKISTVRFKDVPNYILGDIIVNNKHISHIIPHNIRLDSPPIEVSETPEYRSLLDELKAAKTDAEKKAVNNKIDELREIDRYQVKINDKDFYFVRFLLDISRLHWRKELERKEPLTPDEEKEQTLALVNHLFVFGYLASEYKDKGKSWAVWTMDNKISEVGEASGRSGKSMIADGLEYVRPLFTKGGRRLNKAENFNFLYDGYTEFHNIIEIDDFHERGLFDQFYTEITGSREINPKNYSAFTLDYAESGKMMISTNYELHNTDTSTHARILYEIISDYYHEQDTEKNDYLETRKPDLKFGRKLYENFTQDEWNRFYNFIAYCIQLQMRFYKINPPLGNIRKRELRRAMHSGIGNTDDFFKWANTYFVDKPDDYLDEFSPADEGYFNTFICKAALYEEFLKKLSKKQQSDYRIEKFKQHLKSWCQYHDYQFNPKSLCTDHIHDRIMKKLNGKTVECIYIATSNHAVAQTTDNNNDIDEMPF